jgi:hypothetical protein
MLSPRRIQRSHLVARLDRPGPQPEGAFQVRSGFR